MEIWKDIIGYDGLYQISNLGNVYSNITNKQMKPRLVALHFCEKKDGCTEVNHIDCDRTNNNASNLEWVSHRENIMWQAANGTLFPNRGLTYNF